MGDIMTFYKRENYLKKIRGYYDDTETIKVITGVRRCGKSTLMATIMQELLDKGVNEENMIFLDLDSRKYRKIKTDDELEKLIDSQSNADGLKYLFIDEIENVKGFEKVINAFRGGGNFQYLLPVLLTRIF